MKIGLRAGLFATGALLLTLTAGGALAQTAPQPPEPAAEGPAAAPDLPPGPGARAPASRRAATYGVRRSRPLRRATAAGPWPAVTRPLRLHSHRFRKPAHPSRRSRPRRRKADRHEKAEPPGAAPLFFRSDACYRTIGSSA